MVQLYQSITLLAYKYCLWEEFVHVKATNVDSPCSGMANPKKEKTVLVIF